jgi:hypothetical protein
MAKLLNNANVKKYVSDIVRNDYGISDEETIEEFSKTVAEYAFAANLTSYKEVCTYIDGLLTPLDTEQFGALVD